MKSDNPSLPNPLVLPQIKKVFMSIMTDITGFFITSLAMLIVATTLKKYLHLYKLPSRTGLRTLNLCEQTLVENVLGKQ
jgi:hypothetical protein